jgi:hypothetical protein
VRAAEEDLRPAVVRGSTLVISARTRSPTRAAFARDLLVAADDALGAAEVDDHMAELDRLDRRR